MRYVKKKRYVKEKVRMEAEGQKRKNIHRRIPYGQNMTRHSEVRVGIGTVWYDEMRSGARRGRALG